MMIFRKSPNVLLLLALLTYLVRWVGIRLMGSEQVLRATPVHLGLLAFLLLIAIRNEKKNLLWLAGVFVVATLAGGVFSGIVFAPVTLVAGLYQMVFLTGICSLGSLSSLPLWQKITGAVLLSFLLGWLPGTWSALLGYTSGNTAAFSGTWSLYWGGMAALGMGSWAALRLRPSHFAIAALLLEGIFLALLKL